MTTPRYVPAQGRRPAGHQPPPRRFGHCADRTVPGPPDRRATARGSDGPCAAHGVLGWPPPSHTLGPVAADPLPPPVTSAAHQAPMTTPAPRPEHWPLAGLLHCGTCTAAKRPSVEGRHRRFYRCDCIDALHDADTLDADTITAAANHQAARSGGWLRPYVALHIWRSTPIAEHRVRLQELLDHAVVNPGEPRITYTWTTGPNIQAQP